MSGFPRPASRSGRAHGAAAGVLLACAALAAIAAPARAGTEDFSTFSVFGQQEDDESLLDHLLTRPPRAWRDPWERSPQAVRTSQGCLTSGQWIVDTRLKLRAPLGRRASFGLDVRDQHSDQFSASYFDFSFRFPTRAGTPGFLYRPLHDKSRQDLALFWEAGQETAAAVARLTFTFEDVFNSLWSFRQSRVGDESEPYERHPYEPAFWFRVVRPAFRAEAGGVWLTPSRKRFETFSNPASDARATLWGSDAFASMEARVGGLALEAAGANRQALSREKPAGAALFGGDYRRQWSAEAAARHRLATGVDAEVRWVYQEADERSDPPYPAWRVGTVDRALQLEVAMTRGPWAARMGAMHDRITAIRQGAGLRGYGSRIESRAYLGLSARLGQVSLDVVEGIELDPEPYEVWGVHDKAFAHLQTRF